MQMRKVVVNSTPIIALSEIGRLGILKDLYGEIIIPNAVRNEVTAKNPRRLDGHDWVRVTAITNLAAKEMFTSALHDGEIEVMLLAKEVGVIHPPFPQVYSSAILRQCLGGRGNR